MGGGGGGGLSPTCGLGLASSCLAREGKPQLLQTGAMEALDLARIERGLDN